MFERVKETASQEWKLPKDVVLGETLVTLIGRSAVVIENYRGILLYQDDLIKLQIKNGRLVIGGKRLCIEYYNHDEMKITGRIQSVEFCES